MIVYHTDYNSEMEADKNLDGKHAIEEAMSRCSSRLVLTCLIDMNTLARALMRNCPKCQKGA
jgi:hypothetical protein